MQTFSRRTIGGLQCVVTNTTAPPKTVVILCHGFGAPGTDLVPIAEEIEAAQEITGVVQYIFPSAPFQLDGYDDARAWWPISLSQFEELAQPNGFRHIADFVPDELPECHQHIVDMVESLSQEHDLPPEKFIVGGFSQGAMLTTDVFLRSGIDLGGLIIWSGALINQTAWREAIGEAPRKPVVQTHGFLDPVIQFQSATALRRLLQECLDVNFFSFQGYHQIPMQAIQMAGKLIRDTSSGGVTARS